MIEVHQLCTLVYNTLMAEEDKNVTVAPEQQAGWVFNPGDPQPSVPATAQPAVTQQPAPVTDPQKTHVEQHNTGEVAWTASEYVAHERDALWFLTIIGGSVLVATVVYFLTQQDKVSTFMVVFVAIIFLVFALKKPRVLDYKIDEHGVTIDRKQYPFTVFKSFSILEDEAVSSLVLMPQKRFMPILSVYYAQEDEEKIVQKLADYLPFSQYQPDIVDNLLRKIRY